MFTVIEPRQHRHYHHVIDLFLKPIHQNEELNKSFTKINKATFLIMQDNEKGIYGGAVLLKNKISSLHKVLGKHILSKAKGDVWTCTAYLHLDNENLFPEFESFCISFYQELYKKMKEFGVLESTNYLYVKLTAGEYFCTEVLGSWIYVFELAPRESQDGLFHGVLSLKNKPV